MLEGLPFQVTQILDIEAAFTRTLFHLKPHRFRCGYAFCLHDTDRDRCRNRVDLKTLPKVERFQNDTDLSDVVNGRNRIDLSTVTIIARNLHSSIQNGESCTKFSTRMCHHMTSYLPFLF